MGLEQDAKSFAESAHLYSSPIGTVWWFLNFFFRVLIVGGMAKDFLGNELVIQSMSHRLLHGLLIITYYSIYDVRPGTIVFNKFFGTCMSEKSLD